VDYSYSENDEFFYGKEPSIELALSVALTEYPDAGTIWIAEATTRTIGEYLAGDGRRGVRRRC
jgi:hypothetical protein